MKVHYINILLFALPLNILVYNQRNHKISTKSHTAITRLLCECELYTPANYDNDPQMKKIMENFNKQTQQRFHEYDERMQSKRIQCKDECDKEIQKIILKDKLEKQMAQQLTTLETKIDTDDIPTCICEKTMADKVEKGCLRCGSILGAAMPELGSIGGSLLSALYAWKPKAIAAAMIYAMEQGAAQGAIAGKAAGMKVVIGVLKSFGVEKLGIKPLDSFFTKGYYINVEELTSAILNQRQAMCVAPFTLDINTCDEIARNFGILLKGGGGAHQNTINIKTVLNGIVSKADINAVDAGVAKSARVIAGITTKQTTAINTAYGGYHTAIITSVVAIVVIVLIMVTIYLILRYRRKKKMKKKLQYIKLLEE
ncbi:rifin [Plasmodium reichenowi]|uniref:Rifin n=1 Tax=Plasmodium reichenowi TaxID=5854 RepID=A0A060RMB4_PLARE|nr:rifin [Plasmodium reichenowi]